MPLDSITGFEEFYAEPPMRPEEAVEELEMYDIKYSVATYIPHLVILLWLMVSRAEKVVQRYRAARRFNIDRERIFSAYLTFGGIRTVPIFPLLLFPPHALVFRELTM